MANKRKILEVNNHKLRKKRFKVTSTQPDYYSKNQESINPRNQILNPCQPPVILTVKIFVLKIL